MILSSSVVKGKAAFTLIELMAAVVIVGVLVALAVPRYRVFVAKSRQSEAAINLGIIAKLQQNYFNENDGSYFGTLAMGKGTSTGTCPTGDVNLLGFRVGDCNELRYHYTSNTSGGGRALNDGSVSTLLIYPGCSGQTDQWDITDKNKLTNTTPVIKKCKE